MNELLSPQEVACTQLKMSAEAQSGIERVSLGLSHFDSLWNQLSIRSWLSRGTHRRGNLFLNHHRQWIIVWAFPASIGMVSMVYAASYT